MSRTDEVERGLQAFAWALAFVGALTVVYPLADLLLTNTPWAFGQVEWRYQVVGRMSQMIITPMLGMALIVAAAIVAKNSVSARLAGWLSLAISAGLLVLTALFVAESGQARAAVPAEAQQIFRIGGLRAIVKNVLSSAGFAVLGWAALRNATVLARGPSREKDRSQLISE